MGLSTQGPVGFISLDAELCLTVTWKGSSGHWASPETPAASFPALAFPSQLRFLYVTSFLVFVRQQTQTQNTHIVVSLAFSPHLPNYQQLSPDSLSWNLYSQTR